MISIKSHVVIGSKNGGKIKGKALVTTEPICFLGGVDVKTGNITEKGHPLLGQCIKDVVLVFPTGKGSTGGSYLIYDTVCNGNGPLCMLNLKIEQVTVVGCIMGEVPLLDKPDQDVTRIIKTGDTVEVDLDSSVISVFQ
ncbi:MAG: DUF126 domain-containing protein [Synergistaceae bacterium]|nr:DUF126 domain-containing protein [Synergistaceae bacterium]